MTPEGAKSQHLRAFAGIIPDGTEWPNRAHNPKVAGLNPAPAI